MADKNVQIAEQVLANVGGTENISTALHCMTRLRLVLKDDGLADVEAIKNIPGVLGVVEQGGQLQVVIGQNVPKVHAAIVAAGVTSGGSVDENLDAAPQKFEWTPKNVGNAILGYLSGSMVPMIPVMMAAGMFKVIAAIIGSSMLGLVADDSNVITLTLTGQSDAFERPYYMKSELEDIAEGDARRYRELEEYTETLEERIRALEERLGPEPEEGGEGNG